MGLSWDLHRWSTPTCRRSWIHMLWTQTCLRISQPRVTKPIKSLWDLVFLNEKNPLPLPDLNSCSPSWVPPISLLYLFPKTSKNTSQRDLLIFLTILFSRLCSIFQALSWIRKVKERNTRYRYQSNKQTTEIQKITIVFLVLVSCTLRFWKTIKGWEMGPSPTCSACDLMFRQRWVGESLPCFKKAKNRPLVTLLLHGQSV